MIVGITGGIGSGKSSAASRFKIDNFGIVNADEVAAEIRADTDVKSELTKILGEDILENEEIKKEKLLEAILNDITRPLVNEVLHPRIKEGIESKIKELNNSGHQDIIIDAPIIEELGLLPMLDYLIFIKSNLGNRIMRIKNRKNYIDSTISKLIMIQEGVDKLEEQSDFVVENNGTEDELNEKIYKIIIKLREK